MNTSIYVGHATGKTRCLIIIAAILSILTDWTFNASAQTLTPLWQFTGGDDGVSPDAPLIQACDGYLYGTTYDGVSSGAGAGIIFESVLQAA